MKHIKLHIEGMNCTSCVGDIESVVQALSGVHNASVSFATSTIHIEYSEEEINEHTIVTAIDKLGYKAHIQGAYTHEHTMSHEDHSDHSMPESRKEIRSKWYKFLFGLVISIVLVLFDVALTVPYESYIGLTLTTILLLYTSREFYTKGLPPFLLRARPNMDTLVALGVSAAYLYSAYNVLLTGNHELYFMDVAIISTFIILGRYLEAKSKGKANEAIQKLLSLGAKVAHKKSGTSIEDIPVDSIVKGDLLLVKPGEKVPVDGIITDGTAVIDESMVTGESIPVDKKEQDTVIGATINSTTSFTMKATKVGANTLLAQMVKLIEQAQMHKAPIQKLVDTVSRYFVWAVVAIAILTFLGWILFSGNYEHALIVTVAVLIIACPCALGLATPISLVVGSGKGAEHGILIKDASALEKVHKVDTICFDKTGTITEGKPHVTDVIYEGVPPKEEKGMLALVASLEAHSEHPLAHAVVAFAEKPSIATNDAKNVVSTTGGGIQGEVNGQLITIGKQTYLESQSIQLPAQLIEKATRFMQDGKTVIYFAIATHAKGAIALQDTAKASAKKAISLLHAQGIHTVMMTGDNELVGASIAKQVGIDEVHANLQPEKKVEIIKELQKSGKFVAMVGDGINDAPALATANIGIAIGTGTDIAIESGDLVLIQGDIAKAVGAIQLSKATINNIQQNLFWAFAYNTIGIPIAALGLLSPMFSAFAMALSSVSVVLNALRLRNLSL